MKTIKRNKNFRRVTDDEAVNLVRNRGWKYCPKWKALKDGERKDKKRGNV